MNKLGFFTPFNFEGDKSYLETVFEASEEYFAFGDYRAFVIPGSAVDGSQEVGVRYCPEGSFKSWLLKTALKVASYVTIILPLIMVTLKLLFRTLCSFHYTSTRDLIEEGINLEPDTLKRIESVVERVIKKEKVGRMRYYDSQDNHRVFSFEEIPDLIFKMKADESIPSITEDDDTMEGRFKSLCYAKTVCRTHHLGLLVVPNAKLFRVQVGGKTHTLLAERKLDLNPDQTGQEALFEKMGSRLDKAIRQLATFISITGYSDVEWRNNPVLNMTDDEGNCMIGLVDVEELNDFKNGIFGGRHRRGLINCVNKTQGEEALEVAKRYFSFWTDQYEDFGRESLKRRRVEIEENDRLHAFHKRRRIVRGDEPIRRGWFELDFSWYPESGRIKNITKELIAKINKKIEKRSSEMSPKGRRLVRIKTTKEGGKFHKMDKLHPDPARGNDEDTYLGIAVKRLLELGYLYQITKKDGRGYILQA